jgi:SAM-dependent methyltransferase
MNALPLGSEPFLASSFDCVLGISAVHHCSNLEALFSACVHLLAPGGMMFLDEYIGPDRFQFEPETIAWLNRWAQSVPERLRVTAKGVIKQGFRAPNIDDVITIDPTEAIRSSEIMEVLRPFFSVVAFRPYGGALLHNFLADIAQHYQSGEGAEVADALIAAESELIRTGKLRHHFGCTIASPRDGGA